MATKVVIADERNAICIVCREKKRVMFSARHDVLVQVTIANSAVDEANVPGFSPSQSRMMPFERRCYHCQLLLRHQLASFAYRRVRHPRTSTLWAAVEDGALHVMLQKLESTHCPPYPASPEALRPALLQAGDYDAERGYTALHCALMSGCEAYKHGFVIDSQTITGAQIRFETVCTLLEYGADPNAGTMLGRDRPLAMAASLGDKRLIEALLAHGADVARTDKRGRTALHSASTEEVIHVLVREGLGTHLRDKDGLTALQVSIAGGEDEGRIRLLMRLGERRRHELEVWAQQGAEAEKARRKEMDAKRDASLAEKAKVKIGPALERAAEQYETARRVRLGLPPAASADERGHERGPPKPGLKVSARREGRTGDASPKKTAASPIKVVTKGAAPAAPVSVPIRVQQPAELEEDPEVAAANLRAVQAKVHARRNSLIVMPREQLITELGRGSR